MWPRLLAVRRYRAMECPRTLIAVHREDEQYEDAVRKLNGLQTNAAVLDLIRQQKGNRQVSEHNKMRQYLLRVGLTVGDLQQLKAIHVSGTKGKVRVFIELHMAVHVTSPL
jgi:folylpolyglutamate synthase